MKKKLLGIVLGTLAFGALNVAHAADDAAAPKTVKKAKVAKKAAPEKKEEAAAEKKEEAKDEAKDEKAAGGANKACSGDH